MVGGMLIRGAKLALAALAVPATALVTALSTPVFAATPAPTPTMIVTSPDPTCAFTNGCVSPTPAPASQGTPTDPTPNAGVRGASVSTPSTGGGGLFPLVPALPLAGLGAAAITWALRRRL